MHLVNVGTIESATGFTGSIIRMLCNRFLDEHLRILMSIMYIYLLYYTRLLDV